MVYFFINIPLDELLRIEDKLTKGSYCLFQFQNASSRYYGIMKKEAYPAFVETLTEDTRKNLETLDKTVFQLFFLSNSTDQITYLGNRKLMVYLGDEN